MCERLHIIPKATERRRGGTRPSRGSASESRHRSAWRTRGGSSRISLRITMRFACTVPSATSPLRTSWPVVRRRSLPNATASWIWRGKGGEQLARPLGPPSDDDRTGHCLGCCTALRWDTTWAEDRATCATRPERRPRDQDRRRAAQCRPVFPPFRIGTKAVNRHVFFSSVYSVSHDTGFSISR